MALIDGINVDLKVGEERKRAPLLAAASREPVTRS